MQKEPWYFRSTHPTGRDWANMQRLHATMESLLLTEVQARRHGTARSPRAYLCVHSDVLRATESPSRSIQWRWPQVVLVSLRNESMPRQKRHIHVTPTTRQDR